MDMRDLKSIKPTKLTEAEKEAEELGFLLPNPRWLPPEEGQNILIEKVVGWTLKVARKPKRVKRRGILERLKHIIGRSK
jgi:hypothetical protein